MFPVVADSGLRSPITGIAGCCACAMRGHAAAAPPSSVMKSRRLIGLVSSERGPHATTLLTNGPAVQRGKINRGMAEMGQNRKGSQRALVVRFCLKSRHRCCVPVRPLRAKSGRKQMQQKRARMRSYSITSSARASSVGLPPLALSGALLVRRDHGDASMHRVHDLAPRLSIKPIGELVQPLVQSAPKLNAGGNRWRRFDRA